MLVNVWHNTWRGKKSAIQFLVSSSLGEEGWDFSVSLHGNEDHRLRVNPTHHCSILFIQKRHLFPKSQSHHPYCRTQFPTFTQETPMAAPIPQHFGPGWRDPRCRQDHKTERSQQQSNRHVCSNTTSLFVSFFLPVAPTFHILEDDTGRPHRQKNHKTYSEWVPTWQ
jgi:hypothetical protein